jgi:hypothetical protein
VGGAWLGHQLHRLRVFLSPSMQIPGYYLNYTITVSFQTISSSLFVDHHTNDLHSLNMTMSQNNPSDYTSIFLSSNLTVNTKSGYRLTFMKFSLNAMSMQTVLILALLNFHKQHQQHKVEIRLVPCNVGTRGFVRTHRL